MIGEPEFQYQLGGYIRWVQNDETPKKADGSNMDLLFQIDSENNADLMWEILG